MYNFIQFIILILNAHAILDDDKYKQLIYIFVEHFIELIETKSLKEQKENIAMQFPDLLKKADEQMKENLSYTSIKQIWQNVSVSVINRITNVNLSEVTYIKLYNLIQDEIKKQKEGELSIYTQADYIKVGKSFFDCLLSVCRNETNIPIAILINSIPEMYNKINELESHMNIYSSKGKVELISKESIRPKNSFIKESRAKEIDYIIEILEKNDKLCLISGIGGIGKTEVCKYLFHAYRNREIDSDITHIGWVTYTNNMIQTLYEQINCSKDKNDIIKGYQQTKSYLNKFGKELLLFVDNIDQTAIYDQEIQHILNLNCKIVVTSRINAFDSVPAYIMGPIGKKWCKQLFYTFYSGQVDDNALEMILKYTSCHTLALELIAKTAQSAHITIKNMAKMLNNLGFSLPNLQEEIWYDENHSILIEHFQKLYTVANLKNKYKNALFRMACWPTKNYNINQLLQLKIFNSYEDIELLEKRGWISFDNDKLFLHPVMAEAIYHSSPNKYNIYKSMFLAMNDALELTTETFFPKKYFLMNDCLHVVKKKNFKYIEYAELLNQIAVILNRSNDNERAYDIQKESIKIKKDLKMQEKNFFTVYNNMALICKNIGESQNNILKLKEALSWAEASEKIGKELYIDNPSKYATTLNNLALCCLCLEDFSTAKINILKSIKIKRKHLGLNANELAQSYNNLAIIYKKEGLNGDIKKTNKVYRLYLRTIKYKNDMDYPIYLYNIASIEFYMKKYDEASVHINEAISIWAKNKNIYSQQLYKAKELKERIFQEFSALQTRQIDTEFN